MYTLSHASSITVVMTVSVSYIYKLEGHIFCFAAV